MKSLFAKLCAAPVAAALIGLATSAALAAPAPPDQPFLWRVEGNGLEKPSYLFGTIHLSNERIAQLHPAAARAFDGADTFYAEISMELPDQMAGAVLMMRRDGKKLSESIGPELTAQLTEQLQAIQPGLDIAILQPMKTWAAAMMVVMLPHQLEGREALDMILWNRAKAGGKSLAGLEEIADQIAAFETLDEAEQVIYLRETLATLADAEDLMAKMIAAYEGGDDAALEKLLAESMQLDGEDEEVKKISERLVASLLTTRDIQMAATIHRILTENPAKSHFFAIGAAHYLGDESIRKHLAAKGYTITRIRE